jgi:hypothetical protein
VDEHRILRKTIERSIIIDMKKIIILGLILLGFGFSSLLVRADVISPGYHYINRCVKVTNLDDFSNISLIAYIVDRIGPSNNINEIKNNECISKGYKFNSINVYWNDKDKSSIIDENKLLIKDFDASISKYIEEKEPLIKEEVEYSLVKSSSGIYSLEKTKVISYYNNGEPNKIETFFNSGINPIIKDIKKETEPLIKKEIQPAIKNDIEQKKDISFEGDDIINSQRNIIKKSFWQKVKCFFSFSKNC